MATHLFLGGSLHGRRVDTGNAPLYFETVSAIAPRRLDTQDRLDQPIVPRYQRETYQRRSLGIDIGIDGEGVDIYAPEGWSALRIFTELADWLRDEAGVPK